MSDTEDTKAGSPPPADGEEQQETTEPAADSADTNQTEQEVPSDNVDSTPTDSAENDVGENAEGDSAGHEKEGGADGVGDFIQKTVDEVTSGTQAGAEAVKFSELIGSSYVGSVVQNRVEGSGKFMFSHGNNYVGEMKDGQFHGKGTLFFPGLGRYEGEWEDGRAISGKYVFEDGLLFKGDDWRYLAPEKGERRFFTEQKNGIPAGGLSQLHNSVPPPNLPIGTFDVGDGFLDVTSMTVCNNDGSVKRPATEQDVLWAKEKAREVIKA